MLKGHVQTARNYKLKTLPKILPSFGRAIELVSRALEQLGHMMKCRNSEGFSEAVNRIALWESCRDSSTREIHLRILPKIHLNMKLGRAIELASRALNPPWCWTKVVNGYSKLRWPKSRFFRQNTIGWSDWPIHHLKQGISHCFIETQYSLERQVKEKVL